MKAFVTGGTGRLGQELVRFLLSKGHEVKMLNPHQKVLPPKAASINGDLTDPKALIEGVKDVDAIFHLAALSPLDGYTAKKEDMYRVHVRGTRMLTDAILSDGKQNVRLIHISSTSVYGKNPHTMPITHDTPPNPDTDYARSKRDGEKVLEERQEELDYVILRPSVIYGPTYLDVYSKFIRYIEQGKMPIFGDGKNVIPFVHSYDVVRAMALAYNTKAARGKEYVVVENKAKTQEDIYRITAAAVGIAEPKFSHMEPGLAKTFISLASIFKRQGVGPAHVEFLSSNRIFDTSKTETELGWNAKVTIEQGIGQMVQMYKAGSDQTNSDQRNMEEGE